MAADPAGEELALGVGVDQGAIGAARDAEVAVETAVPEGDVELLMARMGAGGGEAGGVEIANFPDLNFASHFQSKTALIPFHVII